MEQLWLRPAEGTYAIRVQQDDCRYEVVLFFRKTQYHVMKSFRVLSMSKMSLASLANFRAGTNLDSKIFVAPAWRKSINLTKFPQFSTANGNGEVVSVGEIALPLYSYATYVYVSGSSLSTFLPWKFHLERHLLLLYPWDISLWAKDFPLALETCGDLLDSKEDGNNMPEHPSSRHELDIDQRQLNGQARSVSKSYAAHNISLLTSASVG